MVEEEYDEEDEPRIYWKWPLFLFITFWAIVLGPLIIYPFIIGPWLFERELHQNIGKWNSHGINSYSITVESTAVDFREGFSSVIVLTVRDSVIAGVEGAATEGVAIQKRYGRYMISSLFDEIGSCKPIFCDVQYDETYGFPERFSDGFLSSYTIKILDFTPIEDGDIP